MAQDDPLLGRQAFKTYRAARMQLIRADANLCAETIFEPICKTGGRIDHDRSRIYFA